MTWIDLHRGPSRQMRRCISADRDNAYTSIETLSKLMVPNVELETVPRSYVG